LFLIQENPVICHVCSITLSPSWQNKSQLAMSCFEC
jgi:hypothetical protein